MRTSDYLIGEHCVRTTLLGLMLLNQAAGGLKLRHAAIRAAQGGNYLSAFKGRGMEFSLLRLRRR